MGGFVSVKGKDDPASVDCVKKRMNLQEQINPFIFVCRSGLKMLLNLQDPFSRARVQTIELEY